MSDAEIKPAGGTGITSEMSVRLHHVAAFHREHGRLPSTVDGSEQFWLYRDWEGQNVSNLLMRPNITPLEVKKTDFNHGWQYGWYDEVDALNLNLMAHVTARFRAGRRAPLPTGFCCGLMRGRSTASP